VVYAAAAVTQESQTVLFIVTGAMVTIITMGITVMSKRKTEIRANEQFNKVNAERLMEKADDNERDIAKEKRLNDRQDALQAHLEQQAKQTLTKLQDVEDLGKVTHALVNSGATAAMKDQRDGWIVTLALMREIEALKQHNGEQPTDETKKAIALLQQRIATMESNIADRVKQQELAESMIAVEKEIIDRANRTVPAVKPT
jgi:hypothetical protein